MSFIETSVLKNSTIMFLYSEKNEIHMQPHYQRAGQVWTREKKQLLIDSILNDYDLPKIYFHDLEDISDNSNEYLYAVIDGRQRLEAIWEFMDGVFPLSDEFEYQKDDKINLTGLYYNDIATQYPKIRIRLDSFVLPVVLVKTSDDDIDLIEDMFSRLNEAVPLNAAEKRNAFGGNLVKAITRLSEHKFFKEHVKFGNKRYQHRESTARMLLVENCFHDGGRLIDTKKVYLDNLAKKYKTGKKKHVQLLEASVKNVLDDMVKIFSKSDELLSAQGNIVIYYLLFKEALESNKLDKITRKKFLDFAITLKENREKAEEEFMEASYELLEYDRLAQQGTNDASNIRERYSILAETLGLSGSLFAPSSDSSKA